MEVLDSGGFRRREEEEDEEEEDEDEARALHVVPVSHYLGALAAKRL